MINIFTAVKYDCILHRCVIVVFNKDNFWPEIFFNQRTNGPVNAHLTIDQV